MFVHGKVAFLSLRYERGERLGPVCFPVPPHLFPTTEKAPVIYLNDKAGEGIQFVPHCAALCLSRVYCGWNWGGGAREPVTSTE